MKQLAIKAKNISKQYRLGEVGTGTLSHDLNRFWAKVRGQEDPYLKIGDSNDRSQKGTSDYVWSLTDINFEIEQGDAVGIIGRNGAGKSTLLKLLSKVTRPTTGSFKVNGRIASLLEVGTGFNPEMTGRENIYLNGAILGMRKHEITRKFDEIVDFSGVERYIDTPVKRYSSGMYVRLAFAVAAHLESEILIVDEVLAVGDAEFQRKCLGKMGDVSKGEGRTVLFVSHNMPSIKTLCNKGILLNNGQIAFNGTTTATLDFYTNSFLGDNKPVYTGKQKNSYIEELYIFCEKKNKVLHSVEKEDDEVFLYIKLVMEFYNGYTLGFTIFNIEGIAIISMPPFENFFKNLDNRAFVKIKIPVENLKAGTYYLEGIFCRSGDVFEKSDSFISIVIEPKNRFELAGNGILGLLMNNNDWSLV
jgi:lipopolysaccharide transport system ATP-binding protein